jgi:hypothetical protein
MNDRSCSRKVSGRKEGSERGRINVEVRKYVKIRNINANISLSLQMEVLP